MRAYNSVGLYYRRRNFEVAMGTRVKCQRSKEAYTQWCYFFKIEVCIARVTIVAFHLCYSYAIVELLEHNVGYYSNSRWISSFNEVECGTSTVYNSLCLKEICDLLLWSVDTLYIPTIVNNYCVTTVCESEITYIVLLRNAPVNCRRWHRLYRYIISSSGWCYTVQIAINV